MELDDRIWSTLKGGNNMPYNASRPLRKLRDTKQQDEMEHIFKELWENLYNEGKVGLASYLSVPQLISICIDKKSLDRNFIGLCAVIERCRIADANPELPIEYQDLYFDAMGKFEKYLLLNFKNISDRASLTLTLALLATVNGQPEVGRAIEMMEAG